MVKLILNDNEISILSSLIGKRLIKYRHDSFDKLGDQMVFGSVELFVDENIARLNYEHTPYPLFGSEEDEHPKFSVGVIDKDSFVESKEKIYVECGERIADVVLVNESAHVKWDGKEDEVVCLKAIILKLETSELAFQGDYMMPFIEIIKNADAKACLVREADEFADDPDTSYSCERTFVHLSER